MATVTGLTAARMLEIEAASVVDGEIDGSGHLILTTHGGTEIDAGYSLVAVPDASATQKGVVELATDAEIATGTDTTRAITPAGLASVGIPQVKDDLSDLEDVVTSLDVDVSVLELRVDYLEEIQVFRLVPASYTQLTATTSYPEGESILYLTGAQATTGGWTFGGKDGSVRTYRNGNNAHQTWQRVHANTVVPELWVRGGNLSGWSSWRFLSRSAALPDPTLLTYGAAIGIPATSWADLPNLAQISLTLPYDAIVEVEFGVWLIAPGTTNVRAGISHNGATPDNLFGGTWGSVPYTSAGNGHYQINVKNRLAAGVHTFRPRAYSSSGTGGCNYPVFRVTVIRWAE